MTASVPIQDRRSRLAHCRSRSPPVASDNSHLLLLIFAEAQLGRGEQTVDNQYIPVSAIVDKLGLTILADDEERRHFALTDPGRELDVDLAAIIVGVDRSPWRVVAFDHIAVTALINFRDHRRWRQSVGAAR